MEILRKQILSQIKNEIKYQYPKLTWVITSLISDTISLFVLFQISKAFIPKEGILSLKNQNYFSYIFWGLEVIRIPSYLCINPARNMKKVLLEGTFEYILTFPGSNFKKFFFPSIIGSLIEFSRLILQIILAYLFFNLKINLISTSFVILEILLFLPFFFSLGIIATNIFLKYGRGEALMPKLVSIATILSGAYFPLEVFPKGITYILNILSPFNHLLNTCRMLLSSQSNSIEKITSTNNVIFIIFSLIFFITSIFMFDYFLNDYLKYKKKASILI